MLPNFHLSLGVRSIEESVSFFADKLGARVIHRDPSGYVNIDFYGAQITLKADPGIVPSLAHFHFGVNLPLEEFARLADGLGVTPETWDAGTPLERRKFYLKCPTGYVIELKGYP